MSNAPPARAASLLASAHAALRRGDELPAEMAYRQALAAGAGAVARLGLGMALARQLRPREARAELLAAASELPRQLKGAALADALTELAATLVELHAEADAQKPLERALKLVPTAARAHHLHAQALARAGLPAAALAAARRAHTLAGAGASNAAILLATLEGRQGQPDAALARLAAIAQDDPNHARARFEMARLADARGDYLAAFALLREAGACARRAPAGAAFDLDAVHRELAADAALAADWPFSATPDDALPAPAFLLGFYRSGTTLIEQILAGHPAVLGSDEADLVPWVLRALARETRLPWAEALRQGGEPLRRGLRERYWARARQLFGAEPERRLLLDKTALNSVNLAFIHALFPEARIVFVARDPRDACVSTFMQALRPNALSAQFLDWERGVRFYVAVARHALSLREYLPLAWLTLRYEDVLDDYRGAAERALVHLGLGWDDAVADYRRGAAARRLSTPSREAVTEPLNRHAVGRWRRYAFAFSDTERAQLAPVLDALGYPGWDD